MSDFSWAIDIDRDSRIPIYQQIFAKLHAAITNGSLPPGTAFPSQQEFSQILEVNHITFRKAMGMLEKEGLIARKRRVGTFVQPASNWKTQNKIHRLGIVEWRKAPQTPESDKNPYTVDLLSTLIQECSRLDMEAHMIYINPATDSLEERVSELSVEGIISFAAAHQLQRDQLAALTIPRVAMEYEVRIPDVDNIAIDSIPGQYDATMELIRLGHWDIAYVGAMLWDHDNPSPNNWKMPQDMPARITGYRNALEDSGIRYQKERIYEISMDQEPANQLIAQLKRQDRLPTAICAFDDKVASHLLIACEENDISVPEDLSLIGFGSFTTEALSGRLASVKIDWPGMARIAARRIQERMIQGGIAGIRATVTTEFCPGASIAAPSAVS